MQIADFFRAAVLKSSDAAFQLALDSHENVNFARAIISAKSNGAHARLAKIKPKEINFHYTQMKAKKYDAFLMMIDHIKMKSSTMTISEPDSSGVCWFSRH